MDGAICVQWSPLDKMFAFSCEVFTFVVVKPSCWTMLELQNRGRKQKTHKHFSDCPCGTIVQGRTFTPPRDKRDKRRFCCGIIKVNRKKSSFSQGWVRGPVCPRDGSCLSRTLSRPKCLCLLVFFLARKTTRSSDVWSIAARGAEQEGRNPAQGSRGFGAP